MEAEKKKAEKKAKIAAEMERMKAKKAVDKAAAGGGAANAEATTPKTRATTPVRAAPKADAAAAGGGGGGAVDMKAAAAAKRKAKIAAEAAKQKKAAAEKKRAATPPRDGAPKAAAADADGGGDKKAEAAARKKELMRERMERQKAKKRAAAAKVDEPAAGAKAAGLDPQTPPARPTATDAKEDSSEAPKAATKVTAVTRVAKSPHRGGKGASKMTPKEKIEAKKEEMKRARLAKSNGGGDSASSVATSDSATSDAANEAAAAVAPELEVETASPEEEGADPPPLPAGQEQARPQPAASRTKKKGSKKKKKKEASTPTRAEETAPVDKAEILQRLHTSADQGNYPGMQAAIEDALASGTDLNARDPTRDNCSAVYLAAKGGHARLIELLHNNGADLMVVGSMDATPLFIACYHGFEEVVGVIADRLPTDERWRAMDDHVVNGATVIKKHDIFKLENTRQGYCEGTIVGNDQDWPRVGTERVTLPVAIFERVNEKEIQLEKRVDSSTPFFIACQEGNVEAAKVLFDAGVDIEAPDRQGATPFYSACQQGQLDIVRYLFGKENPKSGEILDPEKGLIVNGVDETPRDTAERWRQTEVISFLNEPYKSGPSQFSGQSGGAQRYPGGLSAAAAADAASTLPAFDKEVDDADSDTDDERDLLRKMPGLSAQVAQSLGAVGSPMALGMGLPPTQSPGTGPGTLQKEEQEKLKKIKRGKTKTLDLAMKRRGSVYSAGFLVEDDESEEFEADGEEEDETRLRLTQLTRAVLFVGISVFAILSHFAPGLLVLTAILSVLLIAAPAHYANADSTTGLPGGKTKRSIPAVQLGLCLFISIFAGAAQFVPGVLVIFSTLILLLLAAPASKDDGTKKHAWR